MAGRLPSHHPANRLIPRLVLSGVLLHSALLAVSQAQTSPPPITLDGSLGSSGPLVPRPGTQDYVIGHDLGQMRGSNLFHSFGRFNVVTGGSATFTGPESIANILGRVTGGERSLIDGVLRSEIPGANLFLLNPSGVIFGQNATLDLKGSFHVSTADFMRMADGGIFYANLANESVLTAAAPSAFGFLGLSPAAITVQKSALEVPEGRSLSLIGGDVSVVGGPDGLLRARSGRVTVGSVASPGDVTFDAATQSPDVNLGSFSRLGRIDLSGTATLSTTGALGGPGGGTVTIRGGRLVMRNSNLLASTNGDIDGARTGIDVRVAEDVVLDNSLVLAGNSFSGRSGDIVVAARSVTTQNESEIETNTVRAGRAGDLTVEAGRLTVTGGSRIRSRTLGSGPGGTVTIRASDSISLAGSGAGGPSHLSSFTDDTGPGGVLTVSAPTATVSLDGGFVFTSTSGAGRAGDLTVEAGRLTVTGGGGIGSETVGSEPGGTVTIRASDSISLAGSGAGGPSRLFSFTDGAARGGKLTVSAPTATVALDGGIVLTRTRGSGTAGDIDLDVSRLTLNGGSSVSGIASGGGGAGNVTVKASESVAVAQGSLISSGVTRPGASGTSGRVVISTPALRLDDGFVSGLALSSAPAGDVEIRARTVSLTAGGRIEAGTAGAGAGGTIVITGLDPDQPAEVVSLSGRGRIGASGISSQTSGSGNAGRVSVFARSLNVDGGAITSNTFSSGSGGDIALNVGSLTAAGRTFVSSSSGPLATGRGGTVTVKATESVTISSGSAFGAFSLGSGDAGRISISAPSLSMDGGAVVTTLAAAGGRAGSVAVTAESLRLNGASIDSTTLGAGPGGDIEVRARATALENGASIAASSEQTGNAGSVTILGDTFRSDRSSVSTKATQADGGDITMLLGERLHLVDSQITTSVGTGQGRGGNILIDPRFVILDRSQILAEAFGGPGGNVRISARVFLASPDSRLSAKSTLGEAGTVDILAPVTVLSGTLAPLPEAPLQATALLREACAARLRGGQASSLVLGGRDGVPPEPGGVLRSPLYREEDWTGSSIGQGRNQPDEAEASADLLGSTAPAPAAAQDSRQPPFSQAALQLECSK